MRLTGGKLRGQEFAQPTTRSVRPLSGKVLQALYNVVGSVDGAVVLDGYAGSGAAGFEALSRGALIVEAVEANQRVARVVMNNVRKLGVENNYLLHVMTLATWLARPQVQAEPPRFSLIIADPPYTQLDEDILERLEPHLVPQGVLVVSHSSKRPSPVLKSLELAQSKTYGDSALSFYRPSSRFDS